MIDELVTVINCHQQVLFVINDLKDIHENGITPDIIVEATDEDLVQLPEPYNKDKQLYEAIKILSLEQISQTE